MMMAPLDQPPVEDVSLAPGEFYFGRGHMRIHTLLGSCVAITMWHPRKHIGGMCHYLLPERGQNLRLSHGHYADDALELFLTALRRTHTRPREYEVKLFGGGNMFQVFGQSGSSINVSRNNIEGGAKLLKEHGFAIKAMDVGGVRHRKIFLELWNGDVWVQRGGPLVVRDRVDP